MQKAPGAPEPAAVMAQNELSRATSAVSGKYLVPHTNAMQADNEFPYVPFNPDSYDDTASIKEQFAQTAIGGNWMVPFEQQDAEYLMRKRAAIDKFDFDRWVYDKYDLTDPAQLFMFQQIAPEQFQRRLEIIDYEQNIVSKYAKLRLLGARTMEDLQFEWLIETGKIELPAGPIWDPKQWMANQGINTTFDQLNTRYQAGLFSPLSWVTQTEVGWQPNNANRADPRGRPGVYKPGQIFAGSNNKNNFGERYGKNPLQNDIGVYGPASVPNKQGYPVGGVDARNNRRYNP